MNVVCTANVQSDCHCSSAHLVCVCGESIAAWSKRCSIVASVEMPTTARRDIVKAHSLRPSTMEIYATNDESSKALD